MYVKSFCYTKKERYKNRINQPPRPGNKTCNDQIIRCPGHPSFKSYSLYTSPVLKIGDFRYLLIGEKGVGKNLLKAKDPSLALRMTVLYGIIEGERRGDSMKALKTMTKFVIESPLLSPPAFTQQNVILSGSEGSPRILTD